MNVAGLQDQMHWINSTCTMYDYGEVMWWSLWGVCMYIYSSLVLRPSHECVCEGGRVWERGYIYSVFIQDQLQALAVEESRIQQLARDTCGREETLKEAVKKKEEALARQEDMLGAREVEVARREVDVSSREEGLRGREERVREMERLACEAHKSLVQCMEQDVRHRVEEVLGGQREEAGKLETCLKEKNKEIQRLRQCHEAVRQANSNLKREVRCVHVTPGS